jgi:hypothetical protein
LLYLSRVQPNSNDFFIVMPFMLMKALNEMLLTSFKGPIIPNDLLLIPTRDCHYHYWQDLKCLHGYYQRALVEALINVRDTKIQAFVNRIKRLQINRTKATDAGKVVIIDNEIADAELCLTKEQQKNWLLSDIFRGAKGDETLLRREVRLRELKVFIEKERFLAQKNSVPALSTSVLCDDNVTRGLAEGIYRCAINNANVDHRWAIDSVSGKPLAIFMQDKHSALETDDSKVSYQFLGNWYTQTLRSVGKYREYYDVVLVFFTNRHCIEKVEDLPELFRSMPHLLLIDDSCIKDYLSPTFAHRGLVKLQEGHESEQVLSQPMDM